MELLDAFARQSDEAISQCARQQLFTFLDNSITKLARALHCGSAQLMPHRLAAAEQRGGGGGGEAGEPAGGRAMEEGTGDFGELAPEEDVDEDEAIDLT